MQLFVTEYKKKDTTLVIADTELLSQLRKVLRASIGDIIYIQSPAKETKKTRYEVRIEVRDDEILDGTILSEQAYDVPQGTRSMIIAMPNKRDKAELIVQKLTECGLDQIIFRPSERSVIKERNTKKEERLHKIIKEAVEQSRGWTMPTVTFTSTIDEYIKNTTLIVFDRQIENGKLRIENKKSKDYGLSTIVGIVGPEGGLTPRDYQQFEAYTPKIVSLGETILRTETAAIVGGWTLKNVL